MHGSRKWGLKNEWDDGFARFRVVLEFFLVVAMLAQSPQGHLNTTSDGKDERWHAVSQNGEGNP